jgi:chemotaxis protein MotC
MKAVRIFIVLMWLPTGSSFAAEGYEVSGFLHALYGVQDEIARGDLSALSLQKELADRLRDSLENPLSKAKDQVEWATVAIGYSLDGANPQVARRLLARVDATNPLHPLALAVSEYTTGNMKEAARLFELVHLDRIDPRIAPYVALATGTANLEVDAKKTIRSFEQAALLGPGTLVEEVALRRLAALAASKGDTALFQRSVNLYIRRYHSSPFAGQFFALLAEKTPSLLDEQKTNDLVELIAAQLPRTYIPVLLALAESHAIAGKLGTIKFIVDTYFSKAAGMGGAAADKIKLYQVISAPVSSYDDHTLETVIGINAASLSAHETVLLGKAINMLEGILEPLSASVEDKAKAAKKIFQPKSEAQSGYADEGKSPLSLANAGSGQASASESHTGNETAEAKVAQTEVTPVLAGARKNAEASKDQSKAKSLPDLQEIEPFIEEIDAFTKKAKVSLQAVDDLLKEAQP